jgi:hypothetical protein
MAHATPTDPEALRAEITQTRAELGKTIEALVAKTDVKARAKVAVEQTTDQAKEKLRSVRHQVLETASTAGKRAPVVAVAVAALAFAGIAIYLLRRRRS